MPENTIKVIDYGRGNLFSIESALSHIGLETKFVSSPDEILLPGPTILPGVGAFGDAMDALKSGEIVEAIRQFSQSGDPLLGICLGMQVLATRGEEFGDHAGLDIVKGAVIRLPEGDPNTDTIRVPNVGWRRVAVLQTGTEISSALDAGYFYFVHSYYLSVEKSDEVLATLRFNGADVAAVVRRENVVGCQFHPERSGACGLNLLKAAFAV